MKRFVIKQLMIFYDVKTKYYPLYFRKTKFELEKRT